MLGVLLVLSLFFFSFRHRHSHPEEDVNHARWQFGELKILCSFSNSDNTC